MRTVLTYIRIYVELKYWAFSKMTKLRTKLAAFLTSTGVPLEEGAHRLDIKNENKITLVIPHWGNLPNYSSM